MRARRGERRVTVQDMKFDGLQDGGARFLALRAVHGQGPLEGVGGEDWGRHNARSVAGILRSIQRR